MREFVLPRDAVLVLPRLLQRLAADVALAFSAVHPDFVILRASASHECVTLSVREDCAGHAHGAGRVVHVDDGAGIIRLDLHSGVDLARGGSTDEQRDGESLALHLTGDERHFLQRRSDESGEADDIGLLTTRGLENLRARNHHAEVYDVIVVTLEDDADDVLADVVYVALHGGHDDLTLGSRGLAVGVLLLLRLDVGNEVGDGAFHHARRFHDLWQEHLAAAEEIADDVHAVHQGPFNDGDGMRAELSRFLGVVHDEIGDPVDERVLEPLVHRTVAPGKVRGRSGGLALHAIGHFE